MALNKLSQAVSSFFKTGSKLEAHPAQPTPPKRGVATQRIAQSNPLIKPKGLDLAPAGSPTHFLSQAPILSKQEMPAILQALEAEAAIGPVLSHQEGLKVLINRLSYDKTSQPFDRPSGPGHTGYVVPPLAYLTQHRAVFDKHRPPNHGPVRLDTLNIHIANDLPAAEHQRLQAALNTLNDTPSGAALLNRAKQVNHPSQLLPGTHHQDSHASGPHYLLDLQNDTGEIHLPDISASAKASDQISTRTNTLTALHDASTLAHEIGHKILTPIRLRQDLIGYAQYIQGNISSIDLANHKRAGLQLEENIAVIIENLARRDLGHPLRYPEYDGGYTKRLVHLGADSLSESARHVLAQSHAETLDAFLASTGIDPQRLMVLDPSTQQLRALGPDEHLSLKPLGETRRRRLPHAVTLTDILNTQTAIGRQFDARHPVVQINGPLDDALIERLSGQALDLGTADQPTATYHISPSKGQFVSIALRGTHANITILPEHFELILQSAPQTTLRIQFDDEAKARQTKTDTVLMAEKFQRLINPLTNTTVHLHTTTDPASGAAISRPLNAREFHLFRTYATGLLKP